MLCFAQLHAQRSCARALPCTLQNYVLQKVVQCFCAHPLAFVKLAGKYKTLFCIKN